MVSLDEHNRRSEKLANAILASALRRARAAGVACQSDYAQSDHPYRAIIDAAQRRGLRRHLHGFARPQGPWRAVARQPTMDVLTHSTIPTLVYR